MKNLKLNYASSGIQAAITITMVILYMPLLFLPGHKYDVTKGEGIALLVYAFAVMILTVICLAAVYEAETVVSFGRGRRIKCRWLFVRWEIDISKASYFIYTIETHRVRGGMMQTFNVEFAFAGKYGEDRKCLKVKLDADSIVECVQNGYDTIPLMEVYRYAEERYPEKAKGLEK